LGVLSAGVVVEAVVPLVFPAFKLEKKSSSAAVGGFS
jgi:hypothetical protein